MRAKKQTNDHSITKGNETNAGEITYPDYLQKQLKSEKIPANLLGVANYNIGAPTKIMK